MLLLERISIINTEPYDKKKYRDDFGNKPNPFKTVCHCKAYFTNGTSLELTLKFTESKVSEEKAMERAVILLSNVGLLSQGGVQDE